MAHTKTSIQLVENSQELAAIVRDSTTNTSVIDEPRSSDEKVHNDLGVCVGLFFNWFTLFILLLVIPKLWRLMRIRILTQMCACLAVASSVTVLGFSPPVTQNTSACKAVSAMIHYFYLSLFCWMLVEGFYLRRVLINVYSSEISHLFGKMCAFAWGLPLLVVVTTMASDGFKLDSYHKEYDNSTTMICFIQGAAYYIADLTPISLILAVNFIVFITVLYNIAVKGQSPSQEPRARNTIDIRRQIIGTISLAIVLGITWIPVIALENLVSPEVFSIFFNISVAMSGVILFTTQIVMQRDIREEAARRFREIGCLLQTSQRRRTSVLSRISLSRQASILENLECKQGKDSPAYLTDEKLSNGMDKRKGIIVLYTSQLRTIELQPVHTVNTQTGPSKA